MPFAVPFQKAMPCLATCSAPPNISQDSVAVSRGRRRGSCFTRGARCLRALRNLKRAHGCLRDTRNDRPTLRTSSTNPVGMPWRTRYGQLDAISRHQRQLHVRSLGVAAPQLRLQTALSTTSCEVCRPPLARPSARLESSSSSSSRNHPQPEAALVSAGRRLRWSRTFPFQRARARELLHLRCTAVAASACSRCIYSSYLHALLRPLLI